MTEEQVAELTKDGQIYHINDFLDAFMTEKGNFWSDTSQYRTRSNDSNYPDIYLFSVDTLPSSGPGIYIRGRISTDDYSGNFYKSMVIQEIVNGEQQNLRITVDLGSSGGMFQIGQEILIRCNGMAVGRYANQPQLCVPSYNNNIFASHSDEKVGWAPGRISSAQFRNNARFIGKPDVSKLQYKELTLTELYEMCEQSPAITIAGMQKVRKQDGMLIRLKGVWFTGQYNKYGDLLPCQAGNPDPGDGNAHDEINVFAPSTGNVGYPQGRVLSDASGKALLCSTSEYAKYAHFYIPGADTTGVAQCPEWKGSVTGILGWYLDHAGNFPNSSTGKDNTKSYKYCWSVTPRGIPGIGIEDIFMEREYLPDEYEEWVPQEYDPTVD